jgi:hypothetical protein
LFSNAFLDQGRIFSVYGFPPFRTVRAVDGLPERGVGDCGACRIGCCRIQYSIHDVGCVPEHPAYRASMPRGDGVAACLFLAGYPLSHSPRGPLVAGTLQIDRP